MSSLWMCACPCVARTCFALLDTNVAANSEPCPLAVDIPGGGERSHVLAHAPHSNSSRSHAHGVAVVSWHIVDRSENLVSRLHGDWLRLPIVKVWWRSNKQTAPHQPPHFFVFSLLVCVARLLLLHWKYSTKMFQPKASHLTMGWRMLEAGDGSIPLLGK